MFTIVPTAKQVSALQGPKTLESLCAADFLGKQSYIDEWICDWLTHNRYSAEDLPLCVSESILCDKKLRKVYRHALKERAMQNDDKWLRHHYIVKTSIWNFIDFCGDRAVSDETFNILWNMDPVPLKWCAFIARPRRIKLWEPFVQLYGGTKTMKCAVQLGWAAGIDCCLQEGVDLENHDFVVYCIRDPQTFRKITNCNPPATQEAYEEFLLQRLLKRVPDIPLVEQWFWIHGFKG